MISKYIENLNWRYATKQFDPNRALSKEQELLLTESFRLAPSSFGLQPYKLIIVENKETRSRLKENAWNQSQITDASFLTILAIRTDINQSFIEDYISLISKTRNATIESLSGMKDMITGFISQRNASEILHWAEKQAYIALGFMLDAAAQNGIDSCPMEGFDNSSFDEILGLKDQNLKSSVVCAFGFRSENDSSAGYKKVRKSAQNLLITV